MYNRKKQKRTFTLMQINIGRKIRMTSTVAKEKNNFPKATISHIIKRKRKIQRRVSGNNSRTFKMETRCLRRVFYFYKRGVFYFGYRDVFLSWILVNTTCRTFCYIMFFIRLIVCGEIYVMKMNDSVKK